MHIAGLSCLNNQLPRDKSKNTNYLACPARFERATYALEGRCSIQLSYGQINAGFEATI